LRRHRVGRRGAADETPEAGEIETAAGAYATDPADPTDPPYPSDAANSADPTQHRQFSLPA
jgi:hypothetical protein